MEDRDLRSNTLWGRYKRIELIEQDLRKQKGEWLDKIAFERKWARKFGIKLSTMDDYLDLFDPEIQLEDDGSRIRWIGD